MTIPHPFESFCLCLTIVIYGLCGSLFLCLCFGVLGKTNNNSNKRNQKNNAKQQDKQTKPTPHTTKNKQAHKFIKIAQTSQHNKNINKTNTRQTH